MGRLIVCVPGLSSEDPEVAKVLADRRRLVGAERAALADDPVLAAEIAAKIRMRP
jgi:hypothetical protein